MSDLSKFFGSFGPINPTIKKMPLVGYDSEDDTKGRVLQHAFYHQADDGSPIRFYTTHSDEAVDYVYSFKKPVVFCAHNLEYDMVNLFKHVNYKYIENMIYTAKLLKFTLYATNSYFLNSGNFFMGTVKKMGDFVGLGKLEPDLSNPEYVCRDAQIVYEFMNKFQNTLVDELGFNLGVTIGQMSMNAYRRSFMVTQKQITYNSPNCLKAYYGGRVEIFEKGTVKDITVSDINSSYPNVMKNYLYPDTATIEPATLATHDYGIGKFTVNVPSSLHIPPLPFKSPQNRLFFPTGVFTGWWTYAEIRYAQTLGVEIIEEHEGEGTNTSCTPFIEFISEYYDRRLTTKRVLKVDSTNVDAKFKDLFYKLFQNNLYGKWCQNKGGTETTTIRKSRRERAKLEIIPGYSESKIGNIYHYRIPREKPPRTANFMWGVYVTSYARIYLHQGMMKVLEAGGRVLYCDTDSIMFTGTNPLPLSDKLGDWDEEKFDLGIFRQAKGYLLCNRGGRPNVSRRRELVSVSKGRVFYPGGSFLCPNLLAKRIKYYIRSRVTDISRQPKEYVIKKVACKGVPNHLAYDFILHGAAVVKKPMRFKESLVRTYAEANAGASPEFLREVGANYWKEVSKQMRSLYIKRIGDTSTRPVSVSEIPELEKRATNHQQGPQSIELGLEREGIVIERPQHKDAFAEIVIPPDTVRKLESQAPSLSESTRIHFLKALECETLDVGEVWFAGKILALESDTQFPYYKIALDTWKGVSAPPNFIAGYSAGISLYAEELLAPIENVGKYLTCILNDTYIEGGSLELDVSFSGASDSRPQASENKNNPGDIDWSKLDELKQQVDSKQAVST